MKTQRKTRLLRSTLKSQVVVLFCTTRLLHYTTATRRHMITYAVHKLSRYTKCVLTHWLHSEPSVRYWVIQSTVFHAFFHKPLSHTIPIAHPKITGFKNRVYTTLIVKFQKSEVKN